MLPIYIAGVALSAYAIGHGQKKLDRLAGVYISPGEDNATTINPADGMIVCCGIYHSLIHTGIWTNDGIVELSGEGLVRLVSPQRFIAQRSGDCIYGLATSTAMPLSDPLLAERALKQVFTYRDYHLIRNNCHRFVAECLQLNQLEDVIMFSDLNSRLSQSYATRLGYFPLSRYNVN